MDKIRAFFVIVFLLGTFFLVFIIAEAIRSLIPRLLATWWMIGLFLCAAEASLSIILLGGDFRETPKNVSSEASKYQTLISKLEEKYTRGEVSSRVFERIRREYETKIKSLEDKIETRELPLFLSQSISADKGVMRGAVSAFLASALGLASSILSYMFYVNLINGVLFIALSVCHAVLGFGFYSIGQKLKLRTMPLSGVASLLKTITLSISALWLINYAISVSLLSPLGMLLYNLLYFFFTPIFLLSINDLIQLAWSLTAGFAFIRIGTLNKKNLETMVGILLLASFPFSFRILPTLGANFSHLGYLLIGVVLYRWRTKSEGKQRVGEK